MSTELHSVPLPKRGSDTARVERFEDFFRDEHVRLYRALCLVVGNSHEAEDVLQAAFVKAYEHWDRVGAMDNPAGYLYRVAMNEFRGRYRSAMRAAKWTFAPTHPEDVYAAIDDHVEVLQALRGLTTQQRAAIVLTGLLGYTSEEAGELLGIEASTVRVLATRARQAMRIKAGERA